MILILKVFNNIKDMTFFNIKMTDSLMEKAIVEVIMKIHKETKHGYLVRYKDKNMKNDNSENLEYISIQDFFSEKDNLDSVDWKWGLNKDDQKFVYEFFDLFIMKRGYV